jgi:choloylglycine hydrolase
LLICFIFLSAIDLSACTGIKLIAKDGSVVHGRTLEFGVQVNTSLVVIPRNYRFTSTTPKGKGLTYKSKYAAVGAITNSTISIMDGINEKGLSIGTFYFPGFASYTQITKENQDKALSPLEFPNWILTQFQNIDEIKTALNNIVIAPTISKEWGNEPPPFHYIVYEKNGDSIVIEPIDGKLVVYDNPIGVITNSPTFDWHINNLRNYINLKPENATPVTLDGIVLTPFGQGSGMTGLPGDFTPPSRFVKATFFSTSAIPSEDAEKSVFQAFHILNQFDIPKGIARNVVKDHVIVDYTMYTNVRDPNSLKFYFKTYDNQNIKVIDLNKFDWDAKKIKKIEVSGFEKPIDISSDLK